MKIILILFTFLLPASLIQAFDHSSLDSILKRYVDGSGMVDYAILKTNRTGLDTYLKTTGAVSQSTFDGWGKDEQLAFLINVYNAETLQYIIDNHPLVSIKKLGGIISTPWDKKNVVLLGENVSLNHLEHRVVRPNYDEPRIHFALVCAAKGCPPLRSEAYTATKLEEQLESQAKAFLNQSSKNRFEKGKLYLSTIFKWYGGDFKGGGQTVSGYVDSYIEGATAGADIEWTDYDWSLNEQ
jgi:hypothetical protein